VNKAARTQPQPAADVEIIVRSPLWNAHRGVKGLLRRALVEAACATRKAGELAIVLTDDESIRAMNGQWRGKNRPTNVLSFPAARSARTEVARNRGGHRHLGDIVIAYQTTVREADAQCKPFNHHVAHLAVHGFLHLLGYDHESPADAEAMERLEVAVLAGLRVPNPYLA
jgi:probable rRNA maturation factor